MSRAGIEALGAKSGEGTATAADRCLDALGWQVRDTIGEVGQGLKHWAERAQAISCHGGPDVVDCDHVVEVCARALGVTPSEVRGARSGLGFAGSSLAIRILRNRIGKPAEKIAEALNYSRETVHRRLRQAAVHDQNGAAISAIEDQICEFLGIVEGLEEIDLSAAFSIIVAPLEARAMIARGDRDAGKPTVFRIGAEIGGDLHEAREVGHGPAPVMAGLSGLVSWADALFSEAVEL